MTEIYFCKDCGYYNSCRSLCMKNPKIISDPIHGEREIYMFYKEKNCNFDCSDFKKRTKKLSWWKRIFK